MLRGKCEYYFLEPSFNIIFFCERSFDFLLEYGLFTHILFIAPWASLLDLNHLLCYTLRSGVNNSLLKGADLPKSHQLLS